MTPGCCTSLLGVVRADLVARLSTLGSALDGLLEVALRGGQGFDLDQAALPLVGGLGDGGQVAIDPLQVLGDGLRIAAEDGGSVRDGDSADKERLDEGRHSDCV